jgi:hypothetical protein
MSHYASAPGSALEAASTINKATSNAIAQSESAPRLPDKDTKTAELINLIKNYQLLVDHDDTLIASRDYKDIDSWVKHVSTAIDNHSGILFNPNIHDYTNTTSIRTIESKAQLLETTTKSIICKTLLNDDNKLCNSLDIMISSAYDNDCLIHGTLTALSPTFREQREIYKNVIADRFRRTIIVTKLLDLIKQESSNTNIYELLGRPSYDDIYFGDNRINSNKIKSDNAKLHLFDNMTIQKIFEKVNYDLMRDIFLFTPPDKFPKQKIYYYIRCLTGFIPPYALEEIHAVFIGTIFNFCYIMFSDAYQAGSPWTLIFGNNGPVIILYNPGRNHYEALYINNKYMYFQSMLELPQGLQELSNESNLFRDFIDNLAAGPLALPAGGPAATSASSIAPPVAPKAPLADTASSSTETVSLTAQSLQRSNTPAASYTQISIAQQPTIYKATLNNDGSVKIYNTDGNEVNYDITENRNTPLTFTVKQIIPS